MRFDSYTPDGFPEEEVSRQSNTDYPYGSFYHTGGGMSPRPHKGGGGKWLVVAVTIALLVGCAQAVGTLPGISRSGITISAGLLRGFDRTFAVRFSFLMSLPAVLGANILSLKDAL